MSIWNRVKLPLIIAVIGISVITLIAVSKPKPAPNQEALAEPAKTQVQVKYAQTEKVTLSIFSQGTVQPKREIDLVAQVSGIIVSVSDNFVDGAFFSAKTPLVVIEQSDYKAAVMSAKAAYTQALRALAEEKGRYRQAQSEWRDLGNSEANNLFLRKPQLAEREAQLSAAKASLETAESNLRRTLISAPFDGRIVASEVDLGQFVTVGTPIAKVYDSAVAEIRIPLTDKQIAQLNLPLYSDKSTQYISPEVIVRGTIAGEQHEWSGRITRTEGSIDIDSRMYYAYAEVDDAFAVSAGKTPMIPGLFVKTEIKGKTRNDVIRLPEIALVKRQYIYTLDDNNSIELTPVNVLRKANDEAWITANIPETKRIVLDKHALISEGTVVTPNVGDDSENMTTTRVTTKEEQVSRTEDKHKAD